MEPLSRPAVSQHPTTGQSRYVAGKQDREVRHAIAVGIAEQGRGVGSRRVDVGTDRREIEDVACGEIQDPVGVGAEEASVTKMAGFEWTR